MDEQDAMRRALLLALGGLGSTSPNPSVGCAVLDAAGELVGLGRTQPPGGAHAEVAALAEAGPRAHGGTAVVTLEPCNATGRTGPCTEALLTAGVVRVVVAVSDPHPRFAGGVERLRAAGVDVEVGLLADEAEQVMAAWLHRTRTGRPHVTWKTATTVDGRSAAADGTSRWITGEGARADVHLLRSRCDAVVVGVGTVVADDPQLTVRGIPGARQPLRVVVDPSGRAPLTARVFDDAAETLHVTGTRDVDEILARIDRVGVLLEGGPTLAGAFAAADRIDRVVAYVAPALLGAGTPTLVTGAFGTIDAAVRLRLLDVRRIDDDVRLVLGRK